MTTNETKNDAAVALGRLGGSVKSAAKTAAAQKNGKKGGRPPKDPRAFRVAVIRDGVRRTADFDEVGAGATVRDAVSLGYVVTCRKLADDEPRIDGVVDEPADAEGGAR